VIFNNSAGISGGAGGLQVSDNYVVGNAEGISVCEAAVRDNHVANNTGLGLEARCLTVSSYAGNRFYANNGGDPEPQVGGSGTFLETGTNFCGSDTVCP
jgi:hypothetical protein